MAQPDDFWDDPMTGEFLQEAREHLQAMEKQLLQLEETSDPASDLVDSLFRAAHSIKGGAGFIGLENVVALAHAVENTFDAVRDATLRPSAEVVDALLQAADRLGEMLEDPRSESDADVTGQLQVLKALLAEPDPTPEAIQEDEPAPDPAPAPAPQPAAAASAAAEGDEQIFLLHYDFPEMTERTGLQPTDLLRDLDGIGAILAARFGDGDWEIFSPGQDAPPFPDGEVLLQTPLDEEHLAAATLVHIERISKPGPEVLTTIAGRTGSAAGRARGSLPATRSGAPAAVRPDRPEAPIPTRTIPETDTGTPSRVSSTGGRTIRIGVELMDTIMALAGELVLVRNQQLALLDSADAKLRDNGRRLDTITTELQEAIMLTRMQPIGNLFDKLPRQVRDLSRALEKEIDLRIHGRDVELDKIILESLSDPLTHIIRNACDHGIEPPSERVAAGKPAMGAVTVRAFQEGGQILIDVRDDGQGIDPLRVRAKALSTGNWSAAELDAMTERELLGLILLPGFSTAGEVSDVSGRGVGMDVVKACVESIGGTIDVTSTLGRGSRVLLRLPLTLAIIPGLVVRAGGERFVIPQVSLEELVAVKAGSDHDRIELAHDQEVVRLRDRLVPVVRLPEILSRPEGVDASARREITTRYAGERERARRMPLHIAVVKTSGERYGIAVDEILGTEEIVVKPLHGSLKRLRCFSGCTIMGDGQVAFILDVDGTSEHANIPFTRLAAGEAEERERHQIQTVDGEEIHDVILFRYGPDEQFGVPLTMVRRIEKLSADEIQRVGDREFVTRDGISTYVIGLDRVLSVSTPRPRPKNMFLLLPRFLHRPVGILVSEILDTVEARIVFREDSYCEDGLLGSMSLRETITLFPDVFRVMEKAEPEWFGEWREHAPPPSHRRALLVEDADFFRHMVRRYLEDGGFEVVTAVNGRDGLGQLNREDFDIVISDLMMPEMDGWSFAEEVRRRARKRNLPMLALSGLQDEQDRRRALDSGFDRYVAKFDREAFLENVVELLEESLKGGAAPATPPPGGGI